MPRCIHWQILTKFRLRQRIGAENAAGPALASDAAQRHSAVAGGSDRRVDQACALRDDCAIRASHAAQQIHAFRADRIPRKFFSSPQFASVRMRSRVATTYADLCFANLSTAAINFAALARLARRNAMSAPPRGRIICRGDPRNHIASARIAAIRDEIRVVTFAQRIENDSSELRSRVATSSHALCSSVVVLMIVANPPSVRLRAWGHGRTSRSSRRQCRRRPGGGREGCWHHSRLPAQGRSFRQSSSTHQPDARSGRRRAGGVERRRLRHGRRHGRRHQADGRGPRAWIRCRASPARSSRYAREKAGEDTVGEIVGSIPGLGQFV